MPVPLPLVAIERASGSVRETCLSGAASTCLPISPEGLHLPPQALDLLLKAGCLGLGHIAVLPVGTVQDRQVARDAGLHLFNALGDLGHCEVLVAIVDRLELPPVVLNDSPPEKVELTAQHDELRAG